MTDMDVTDGNDKGRHVQPQGFIPSHLAAPMLRDSRRTALEYVAEGLGDIRLSAAIMDGPLAARIEGEATRLQRLAKALAAGALVAAFLAAGLVVGGPTTGAAQAAEGPEPDPVAGVSVAARTVPVMLGAAPVTVRIRVTTPHVTPAGWHCASAWATSSVPLQLGPAHLGRACSRYATFTVPVVLGRYTPLGRSVLAVTDDVAPMDTTPARVVLDVRRPSRFGVGYFEDGGRGDLVVRVPVFVYSPAAGRWVPQVQSPVQVQERVGGAWRVRATLTTNPPGLAVGVIHLGGGVHIIRVMRPAGRTVWATTGRVHVFNLLTEPVDVI